MSKKANTSAYGVTEPVDADKKVSQELGNEQAGNDPVPDDSIAIDPQTDEPVVTNPKHAKGTGEEHATDPADNLDEVSDKSKSVPDNGVADTASAAEGVTAPVIAMKNDGENGDVPVELDNSSKFLPSTNEQGYRNMFRNRFGENTIMDDDTAKMFHDNPSFYSYTYDASRHDSAHVATLEWCDSNGNGVGERV